MPSNNIYRKWWTFYSGRPSPTNSPPFRQIILPPHRTKAGHRKRRIPQLLHVFLQRRSIARQPHAADQRQRLQHVELVRDAQRVPTQREQIRLQRLRGHRILQFQKFGGRREEDAQVGEGRLGRGKDMMPSAVVVPMSSKEEERCTYHDCEWS